MSEHTPGPWHVASVIFNKPIEPHTALAVWDETHGMKDDSILGRPVAILTPLEKLNPVDEANATLIAAAPELLEALKRLLAVGSFAMHGEHAEQAAQFARAAIAKAEKGQAMSTIYQTAETATSTLNDVCEELKIVKAQRDRLREAVLLAAKTFKAYGDMHARKLASVTEPDARESISNKAKANFEMAARMEQALLPILTET